eukprot:278732-Rhodomonas_salina.1
MCSGADGSLQEQAAYWRRVRRSADAARPQQAALHHQAHPTFPGQSLLRSSLLDLCKCSPGDSSCLRAACHVTTVVVADVSWSERSQAHWGAVLSIVCSPQSYLWVTRSSPNDFQRRFCLPLGVYAVRLSVFMLSESRY